MFDIGWSEMAVILLVALIVIGPRDLPRVARSMGKWVAKGRSMAREFQTALEDMARETELDKVKGEIEKASRVNIGKTIEKTIDPTGDLGKAFDPSKSDRDAAEPADKSKGEGAQAKALPPAPTPRKTAAKGAAAKEAGAKEAGAKAAAAKDAGSRDAATGPSTTEQAAEPPPAKPAATTAPERAPASAEAR